VAIDTYASLAGVARTQPQSQVTDLRPEMLGRSPGAHMKSRRRRALAMLNLRLITPAAAAVRYRLVQPIPDPPTWNCCWQALAGKTPGTPKTRFAAVKWRHNDPWLTSSQGGLSDRMLRSRRPEAPRRRGADDRPDDGAAVAPDPTGPALPPPVKR